MTNLPSLNQLKQAIGLKEQIVALESRLAAILGGAAPDGGTSPPAVSAPISRGPGRPAGGKMSTEARERIAAAQKARWAKVHAQKSMGVGKPAVVKKRNFSPEARARMAAAVKARWAKFRAAKGQGKPREVPGRPAPRGQGRVFTPEHRAKLAAAQKARWKELASN